MKYQRNYQNTSTHYSHARSAPLPQYEPTSSNYFEENYYIQNAQNPDRLQNYDPSNPRTFGRSSSSDWTEERQFLMKHLGKAQKIGQQTPSNLDNNPFNQTRTHLNPDIKTTTSNLNFPNINRNHLTDFFNSNDCNNAVFESPLSLPSK